MAMVAAGPRPGRMPTTVPRKQPMKHQNRLAGCSATENPCSSPPMTSISKPEKAGRKRDVQDHREREMKSQGHDNRGQTGRQRGAMENECNNDEGEQRETQH